MTPPRLLLFDLGGVLVENIGFERLHRLLPQAMAPHAMRERWLASPSVRAFELGHLPAEDFARDFIAEWALRLSPEQFLDDFSSWPKGLYPGVREALAVLRGKHRLACLSNSNPIHWTRLREHTGEFDFALSSHLLGVIKPDPAAFARALRECGARPEETWFFDDSACNVDAAARLGIRAFHVAGWQATAEVLAEHGLP